MGIIKWAKKQFFRLNEEQRKKTSEFLDKCATGAMLPVGIKFLSDGKDGDVIYITLWLGCATIFALLSIAALAAKEDNDER